MKTEISLVSLSLSPQENCLLIGVLDVLLGENITPKVHIASSNSIVPSVLLEFFPIPELKKDYAERGFVRREKVWSLEGKYMKDCRSIVVGTFIDIRNRNRNLTVSKFSHPDLSLRKFTAMCTAALIGDTVYIPDVSCERVDVAQKMFPHLPCLCVEFKRPIPEGTTQLDRTELLREVLRSGRTLKKKFRDNLFILKIDTEKCYNTNDWEFLISHGRERMLEEIDKFLSIFYM